MAIRGVVLQAVRRLSSIRSIGNCVVAPVLCSSRVVYDWRYTETPGLLRELNEVEVEGVAFAVRVAECLCVLT